jgi:CheY-like chemotaxis protein
MELLSVEYGDFADFFDGDPPYKSQNACLKIKLAVDPKLLDLQGRPDRIATDLGQIFPSVQNSVSHKRTLREGNTHLADTIAYLVGDIIVDLQRDLCEWPAGHSCHCQSTQAGHIYELCIESIEERVARFAAQFAIELVRMMLLQERFDPRMIWVIDLVRHLRRQPRLRLSPKRVAHRLSCSESSAKWAIQALQRYGYLAADQVRRPRRAKKECILIVDDSAQIRDLLGRILEWLGYDVVTAIDGDEGLILLDWANYAAIFVDLVMPSLDGKTFIEHARSNGITSPIFVISAYSHRWQPKELEALGATAFIPKPFSITEIEKLIKSHL